MKKFLFGIFLSLIFMLSVKLDSFADGSYTFYVRGYNGSVDSPRSPRSLNFNGVSGALYCLVVNSGPDANGAYTYQLCSNVVTSIEFANVDLTNGNISSSTLGFTSVSGFDFYKSSSLSGVYVNVTSNIPIFSSLSKVEYYLGTGDTSEAENRDSLPFDSVLGSDTIPTPIVNWALNSDGSVSRTLQFTNGQLPANPNIRMGLQLIVHWASVDNISMSYANQSASALGTGYAVYYDNAVSQDGVAMGYPLPSSVSEMHACPSEINFITDSNSFSLFKSSKLTNSGLITVVLLSKIGLSFIS